jgi:aquaporin Z
VAPLVGAAIAGLVFRGFSDSSATAGTATAGTAAVRPAGDGEDTAGDALDADDERAGEFDNAGFDDGVDGGADTDAGASAGSAADGAVPATGATPGGARPASAGDRTPAARDEARDLFDGPRSK